ncbi:MAG TPA: threonine/serine exporter family protein, partial [Mycobacterium sp.]
MSAVERNDVDADRSIDLALTAARMMLEGGASASSVTAAMRDIGAAVGLGDVTADVNDSVLTISEHGTAHVGAAAISSRTYDFGRLR